MTPQYQEALAGFMHGILARKGFVMLTGDAGTGKTTILRKALQMVPGTRVKFSVILNSSLTASEFLEMVLLGFGIRQIPASKAQRLILLNGFLAQSFHYGAIAAVIVDEAQALSAEVLEEIRLLGNCETTTQKLIQIVLVGQPELAELLDRNALRQLKQRVALRLKLDPLTPAEVGQYIGYRWTYAGAKEPPPFTPEAIAEIVRVSRRIPRLVNAVCDNALMTAAAEETPLVEARHVLEVAQDMSLLPVPREVPPRQSMLSFGKSG